MQQKKYIASLDQSTTTTKFSMFQFDGTLLDQQIISHQQITKNQGWLQHDAIQINANVNKVITAVINRLRQKVNLQIQQILGLGLCNQRQTIICWDSESCQPLYNAIVWCDSRTKDICEKFKQKYKNFANKTGLPVSTYFSLFKIIWLIQNVAGVKQKIKEGKVRFGTIDTWIALMLTGKFVTDASNASRTHLLNINTGKWDKELLSTTELTEECLPTIVNSFQCVGEIKTGALKGVSLSCILGDQQSSAYAHNLTSTQMKITYGTGCFMLCPIGTNPIYNDAFVTTILSQLKSQIQYGFEVSIECGGGTLNWAKKIGLLENYNQLNNLAQLKQQLYFMPSFGSIFSPFWKNNVSGGVIGLNLNTTKQYILKAILESITYRLFDNIKNQNFSKITKIIVDGGMTANKEFMQMQADLFGKQIEVRSLDTCWGVAKGVLTTNSIETKQINLKTQNYFPSQKRGFYMEKYRRWADARNKFYGWVK